MTSPRLRLWQVLRDEYIFFQGHEPNLASDPPSPSEEDFWLFTEQQIKYPQLTSKIYRENDKVSWRLYDGFYEQLDKLENNQGEDKTGEAEKPDDNPSPALKKEICDALNRLLHEQIYTEEELKKDAKLKDKKLYEFYNEEVVKDILEGVLEKDLSEANIETEYKGLSEIQRLRFNRWLLEWTYPDEIVSIDEALTEKYYKAIHQLEGENKHSALCLSGGGIRSATFNLGLLQGLARHGLLEQFHYLSTVSGGGFSGGWLTAWIKRHPDGIEGVMKDLGKPAGKLEAQPGQDPNTPPQPNQNSNPAAQFVPRPLHPEPGPLTWLRDYSNFLSPKLGLFSADTWTLVATVLRNIFLNWLVFVPVLLAALMLPRIWASVMASVPRWTFDVTILSVVRLNVERLSLGIGFLAGMFALLEIGINLPSTRKGRRKDVSKKDFSQKSFLCLCLTPLLISAIALAIYWMRASQQHTQPQLGYFVSYQVAIIFFPWFVAAIYQNKVRAKTTTPKGLFLHFGLATIVIVAVQAFTGWLLYMAATAWSMAAATKESVLFYACFAVPVILLFMSFTGLLLAGLTSNYTDDEDQEWWARAGAWVFITVIGWGAVCVLVIYGPWLLVGLPQKLAESKKNIFSGEMLTLIGGIISGVVAIYGGFSSKVPATDQEAKKPGFAGALVQIAINVAAVLFAVFLVIVLAILTNLLITELLAFISNSSYLIPAAKWLTGQPITFPASTQHTAILYYSPLWFLTLLGLIFLFLGLLLQWPINTNKFSLHYLWRNRIIRAYLGASNPKRQPNLFTGFDSNDNVQMYELQQKERKLQERKLFHVLNFALNLVGGEKLAWQERKAESFSVSPLHCGNYELGYRRSEAYGRQAKAGDNPRRHGISLGTSIAISGAFVSPNMGYMQSSPVIRFLMTLFNVRFGWWLGNPGKAGGGKLSTYNLDSPRFSIKPIVQEALGMTDNKKPYVYLSDGGHFENFGLYEMVLRRCHLIVVGDGTSDADYTFESLAQSLRKIRIDFGIPITFEKFLIAKPSHDEKGVYAAIGTIKYSCLDKTEKTDSTDKSNDGTLILIKPTLTGSEEQDVINYAKQHGTFPQEFIGDQWFSESQFESYRALGSHIIDVLCGGSSKNLNDRKPCETLAAFKNHVEQNLRAVSTTDILQEALKYIRGNGR